MSQRERRKERARQRAKRKQQTTMWVIAGIALVVVAIMVIPALLIQKPPTREYLVDMGNVLGNALGDPNAPVIIQDFSDFQCPYCRIFTEGDEQRLIELYVNTGTVYFIYRSMGEWVGPESVPAAEAAYCAGAQGQFWAYHDVLFANQAGENQGAFAPDRLEFFANSLGLDVPAFQSCMESHQFADQVALDRKEGEDYGVKGTPSLVINGKLVENTSFDVIVAEIEAILGGSE